MDSSSFARGLISGGRIDCSRVFGLLIVPMTRDLDGLFAHWLPNVKTGFSPFGGLGFCQRRFDLFAVKKTPSQSLVGLNLQPVAVLLRRGRGFGPIRIIVTVMTQ
jgi:hypothetical protein